jgi:DNA-3-methyladenine glycosylase
MKNLQPSDKLPRSFYTRNVITVAKELLGKILVKKEGRQLLSGLIVEAEAYDGAVDEAAHTFIGKTKRNEIMFNEGGFFYVYFTYGNHFCCNVVTGKKNHGTAVLIRAIEPLTGIKQMAKNRFGKTSIDDKEKINLTNGPGKVCKAFNISRDHYGLDLTGNHVFILDNSQIKNKDIVITKRIGIKKSADLRWRFYIKDNPYVSKR